ncbi:MAG TPA: carboxypeptidase-like regulatory domain-containing protein [Vicinamibacterales bacterium]|nr:carboxypeptidase-like regulatory domain-containing protein [Vicinamibacterales bacterium]
MMKRQRQAWLLLLFLAPLGSGCGQEKSTPTAPTPTAALPTPAPSVTSLTISGNLTLTTIGETAQLAATARLSDSTTQDVTAAGTWFVDSRVFTINNLGLLTVVGFGAGTVSFEYRPAGARPLSISSIVTASPPGTFAIAGTVKEPGAGGLSGARVVEMLSGRSVTSDTRGEFVMAALPQFPGLLKAEKDGYEPVEVEAISPRVALRLQRVVRVVAGEKVNLRFAPFDLAYTVGSHTCSPCRLIRVVVGQAGLLGVRVTWSAGAVSLSLFVEGKRVAGAAGELTADVPVNAAREVVMYLGVESGGSGSSSAPFLFETSVR